jgi:hypothetical protein
LGGGVRSRAGGSNPAAAWLGARSTISGNTAFSHDGVNGLFGRGGVHVNAPATASFFNATVWANLTHDVEAGGTLATLVFRNSILGNCSVNFGPPTIG